MATNNVFRKRYLQQKFKSKLWFQQSFSFVYNKFLARKLSKKKKYLFCNFSGSCINWFIIISIRMRTSFEVVTWFEFNLQNGILIKSVRYLGDIHLKKSFTLPLYLQFHVLGIVDNFFPISHLVFCRLLNQTSHKVIDT